MDKKLQKAYMYQIKNENVFRRISTWQWRHIFDAKNFPGFSHWMKIQYKEEVSHAMKMYEFL